MNIRRELDDIRQRVGAVKRICAENESGEPRSADTWLVFAAVSRIADAVDRLCKVIEAIEATKVTR